MSILEGSIGILPRRLMIHKDHVEEARVILEDNGIEAIVSHDPNLTLDGYLGGRIKAYQPRNGYRAGVDPVLLAASVPAKPGQKILELGCGAGVASLCLAARIEGLELIGLELQPEYADLARLNAQQNDANFRTIIGDLANMLPELRQMSFDHVLANPPYYQRDKSTEASNSGRETALGEDTPLSDWVKAASKRLTPKGTATFIHRADRLGDLLAAMDGRLGSIQILPLVARVGRDASLVIVRAKKRGKAPLRLHDSLVMHQGQRHERDEGDYSPAIEQCLRDAAPLPFPK